MSQEMLNIFSNLYMDKDMLDNIAFDTIFFLNSKEIWFLWIRTPNQQDRKQMTQPLNECFFHDNITIDFISKKLNRTKIH